jgi:hypothetical protein
MAGAESELSLREEVAEAFSDVRAEIRRFRRDMKRALLLQAIFIVVMTVTLIKLLP